VHCRTHRAARPTAALTFLGTSLARVTVSALHAVFAQDRGRLVSRGDVFDVERNCVFVVWR
jgi:hypothetical protein